MQKAGIVCRTYNIFIFVQSPQQCRLARAVPADKHVHTRAEARHKLALEYQEVFDFHTLESHLFNPH
jgi:hypothetical protein